MPPARPTQPKPNSRFVFSTISRASLLVTRRALPRGARLSGICKWPRLRMLTSFSHHLCFLTQLTASPRNSSLIVMARSLESECSHSLLGRPACRVCLPQARLEAPCSSRQYQSQQWRRRARMLESSLLPYCAAIMSEATYRYDRVDRRILDHNAARTRPS